MGAILSYVLLASVLAIAFSLVRRLRSRLANVAVSVTSLVLMTLSLPVFLERAAPGTGGWIFLVWFAAGCVIGGLYNADSDEQPGAG